MTKDTKTVKRNKPLTGKEKAFIAHLVNNPKATATEAYLSAYDVGENTKKSTIYQEASRTLSKPQVITELSKYTNLVENTIINTINDWGDSDNTRRREIAVESAKWVHDKVHGRATQKVQTESKLVKISINLTGDGELPPPELLDD